MYRNFFFPLRTAVLSRQMLPAGEHPRPYRATGAFATQQHRCRDRAVSPSAVLLLSTGRMCRPKKQICSFESPRGQDRPPFGAKCSLARQVHLSSRGVLKGLDFFCQGPPQGTINRQPPTAANCQLPPTASGDKPPTANHCQPPSTTNPQPPTAANHHQPPPTASRQPPTTHHPPPTHGVPAGFLGKTVYRNLFFPVKDRRAQSQNAAGGRTPTPVQGNGGLRHTTSSLGQGCP